MELCCQGLNSSCKRPAAPCHAPLLPRWLRDVPAALRRSAHEESVMEWLSETPGSIPHCTTATLLLLQPPGQTPKSWEGCLCCLVCQLTNGRPHRWWCPQHRPACSRDLWGGPGEHMPCLAWDASDIPQGGALTSPQQMTNRSLASSAQLRDSVLKCFSLPTWVPLISGLFQCTANPREMCWVKTSTFKVIVIFLEHSGLIYFPGCNAPGQQSLTLTVLK